VNKKTSAIQASDLCIPLSDVFGARRANRLCVPRLPRSCVQAILRDHNLLKI
jgi:hypothetical protein